MSRILFVGDVHGCRDELAELLDRVAFAGGDRLVLVGDLVVRGPDPRGTLELVRAMGGLAVRGNHEDRLLRWRANAEENPLGDYSTETAAQLRPEDWALLEALPLWLDVPLSSRPSEATRLDDVVRVVHAGLVPGVPVEKQDPRVLMYTRALDETGSPVDKAGHVLWGERYVGPPHVVFGHNARPDPQIHEWATGLDTGCVYGGHLTAMVLADGEAPPPRRDRRGALVAVPARRRYV